eukprot:2848134-Pyramimonas_sp.AAC.1
MYHSRGRYSSSSDQGLPRPYRQEGRTEVRGPEEDRPSVHLPGHEARDAHPGTPAGSPAALPREAAGGKVYGR